MITTSGPNSPAQPTATFARWIQTSLGRACAVLGFSMLVACQSSEAVGRTGRSSWQEALAAMPLAEPVKELNRTNAVPLLLKSFASNNVVRALVFVPGATDEFFFFRRARATLASDHPTLLDAVTALTNQTYIRVTFQPPLLLLHTDEDPLVPVITVKHGATVAKLKTGAPVAHWNSFDHDWNYFVPLMTRELRVWVTPGLNSPDSWDFYRHSLAVWNLNPWDAVRAIALAGKTACTVENGHLTFRPDARTHKAPKLD